ncbi:MAG: SHOCT domain-containing protein [Propionibacteriaceae bacterium]|nr:SHOCT domain-containing protein [Propionibacteriaceae bacterium]
MRRFGRPGLIGTAARTAVIAGTAQATMGAVARHQQGRAAAAAQPQVAPEPQLATPPPQPVAPPSAAPAAPGDDLVAQLEQLAQLQSAGVLSPEEFAAAKAKLLG